MTLRRKILLCLALAALNLAVFGQTVTFEFVNYDDDHLVYTHPVVTGGLTADGVRWAFTSTYPTSWQPLTWISRMTDVELFGLDPRGHHFTNLLLHTADTVLLFLLFSAMTGAVGRSAVVAALFAIHPLHVESVAWVSQRKDVLFMLFWLLAMLSYLPYARRPSPLRYLPVLLFFILGMMSKPMIVTLPAVLLLLDFWPLDRIRKRGAPSDGDPPGPYPRFSLPRLVAEKAPLVLLSALSASLAMKVRGAGMELAESPGIALRLSNAAVSYVMYMVKAVWPSGLAFLYPHPQGSLSSIQGLAAGAVLFAFTAAALLRRRGEPFMLTGWFWYVVTLLPVSGLIQMGVQARADRFTYLPLVGLTVAAVWGLHHLSLDRVPVKIRTAAAVLVVAAFAVSSFFQTRHWRNSLALTERAVKVTEGNYIAHNNLGGTYYVTGRYDEARHHYEKALSFKPDHPSSLYNLGSLYEKTGAFDKAVEYLSRAAVVTPGDYDTNIKLAYCLLKLRRASEAETWFRRALAISPSSRDAANGVAQSLAMQGREEEAGSMYRAAMRNPRSRAMTYLKTGDRFLQLGDVKEAERNYRKALEIDPGFDEARKRLGGASASGGMQQ